MTTFADGASNVQDEFKFYMEDAKSKLLLVPTSGNQNAEQAAKELGVPVAVLAFKQSGGALGCMATGRDFSVAGSHAPRLKLYANIDVALLP